MGQPKITFTKHALIQIKDRKISRRLVEEVVRNPGQTVSDAAGNPVAQSRYFDQEEGKEMLLRVFYRQTRDRPKVVTVYRTSQIRKYWQEE